MKLLQFFAFSAVSGDWNQPSWKDVQAAFNGVGRTDLEWGHPVGVRNARKWDDCPKIDEDAIDGKQSILFMDDFKVSQDWTNSDVKERPVP